MRVRTCCHERGSQPTRAHGVHLGSLQSLFSSFDAAFASSTFAVGDISDEQIEREIDLSLYLSK